MIFLLDTNAVGDIVRGNPKIEARVAGLGRSDEAVVSTIVIGETWFGVERMPRGRRRSDLEALVTWVLSRFRSVRVPDAAGPIYAKIKASTQASGIALADNDLWIAATALDVGATVVTRDNDFQSVPGLQLEDWSR